MEIVFNMSLALGRVPLLWKTSCVVLVPKTLHPKDLSSFRPVALTSQLMNTLERVVLKDLRPLVRPSMDLLQFHLTFWILDYLTHRPPVSEGPGLCVVYGCLQYRGPTGNSPGAVRLYNQLCSQCYNLQRRKICIKILQFCASCL